jgi:hypothetical protein
MALGGADNDRAAWAVRIARGMVGYYAQVAAALALAGP